MNFAASLKDFAIAYTRSANLNSLAGAVYQGADTLQVQIPTALGYVVRVADPVAKLRPSSAHFTYFRHDRRSFG